MHVVRAVVVGLPAVALAQIGLVAGGERQLAQAAAIHVYFIDAVSGIAFPLVAEHDFLGRIDGVFVGAGRI